MADKVLPQRVSVRRPAQLWLARIEGYLPQSWNREGREDGRTRAG